jgi:hypothetical protein
MLRKMRSSKLFLSQRRRACKSEQVKRLPSAQLSTAPSPSFTDEFKCARPIAVGALNSPAHSQILMALPSDLSLSVSPLNSKYLKQDVFLNLPQNCSPVSQEVSAYKSYCGFSPFVPNDDDSELLEEDNSYEESFKVNKPASNFSTSVMVDERFDQILSTAYITTLDEPNRDLSISKFLLKEYYKIIDEMLQKTSNIDDSFLKQTVHDQYKVLISRLCKEIDSYASKI